MELKEPMIENEEKRTYEEEIIELNYIEERSRRQDSKRKAGDGEENKEEKVSTP